MNKIETKLKGVYILEPRVFGDHRGYFFESWNERVLHELGIDINFVQDNQSFSAEQGTLRGIHFQTGEWAHSSTYLQWISVELSADNKRQLLIPRGFGHGFVTLTPDVEFLYKADNYYHVEAEGGYRWNDPTIGVEWGIENPILSDKDKQLPFIK